MMKHIPVILLLCFLMLIPDKSTAQSKKAIQAYETFEAGEYFEAIDLFKEAYQKTTDKKAKIKIAYHIAECYRKISDARHAALWYGKVIRKDYENPLMYLYYADASKMQGEYEEAKIYYEKYMELVPDDPRGRIGKESCDMAVQWLEYPNGYEVEDMKYFNSKFSDYAPSYASPDYMEVIFTSTRDESVGKMDHGGTGQGFADLYISTRDRKGKWSTPVPLKEEINTEFEEGATSFSSDYSTMYFTRCEMSKKKSKGCNICQVAKSMDSWGKVEALDLVADSLVSAHPAISADGLTLYFVSDIEGGEGGKDIWKATRTSINDEFGNPINLGEPINTIGNEVFPYAHPDGTLYFSSDGHPGMGGLDIFKAKLDAQGSWKVENMQYPINSPADDFGIVFEKDREAGFLSSSRGRSGDDEIYAFLLPPLKFNVLGIVKDDKTDQPIKNATIKSISSGGITLENETGEDGMFRFMLKPNTDYIFIASKDGYLKNKEKETTKGLNTSTDLQVEIYLSSIEKPIEIENIFFDLDKADLRPESMISLDKLVETLNDNPNVTIELGSHTDSRASDEYNLSLSQRRAQSVVNYLVEKGIKRDRLIAKGYGESLPKIVSKQDHEAYPFLPEGTKLTESYINGIEDEDLREIAHFLNRRTEFRVLRTDYK